MGLFVVSHKRRKYVIIFNFIPSVSFQFLNFNNLG